MRLAAILLASAAMLATASIGVAQTAPRGPATPMVSQPDALADGFRNPPQPARPYAYWHWLDGNISKEGLKLDFDWMRRIGMGGLLLFDGGFGQKPIVARRVSYMSPEWRDAFRYSLGLAKDAHIEIGVASSPGWSQTGAPFVQPRDAMKKLVWSETVVSGGRPIARPLPAPPTRSGAYQDAGLPPELGGGKPHDGPTLAGDVRVVAYRLPAADIALPSPRVSTAAGAFAGALDDGHIAEKLQLPLPTATAPAWVRFDYPRRVTVSSVTLVLTPHAQLWQNPIYPIVIEASDDGRAFRPAARFEMGNFLQRTATFPAIAGRAFRVTIGAPPPLPSPFNAAAPGALAPDLFASSAKTLPLSHLALHAAPRIERAEEKAGFSALDDYYAAATPEVPRAAVIQPSDVIDLTAKLAADGRLDWTPPPGRWRIVRFGWSLTGKTNGPATAEATGLEVDKMNAGRVAAYANTYLDQFATATDTNGQSRDGLTAMIADSIENGFANWTEDLLDQFRVRRGYDPLPYLPALAGHVVGSAAASDRFLYDYRRTIGELIAEAHNGSLADVTHARGMTSYAESLESARVSLGDDMTLRSHADIPTGAMWQFGDEGPRPSAIADLRGAASVAHLAGKPLVAAESMTAAFNYWASSPRELKPVVDAIFAQGANRIIVHSTVHQPLVDQAPGLTLLIFGQYFNRNDSWAEQARPWTDYLSRTSYLLQQGRFVADVAFFYGEEAPLVSLYKNRLNPDVPVRYGYDYVDAETLIERMTVAADGTLVTPGGARYRVLQLGGSSGRMTLTALRKLQALVAGGATVVGEKPTSSPSLADDPAEFARLARALWNGDTGRGRVVAGQPIEAVLASLGVLPDHEVSGVAGAPLAFVHRRLDDGDLWFVSNPQNAPTTREIAFRVAGRAPDLFDAQTGAITPLDYRSERARTIVKVDLAAHGSAFIVFRRAAKVPQRTTPFVAAGPAMPLADGWTVEFQPGRGAPAGAVAMPLGSLSRSKDPDIRYFSGTATYRRTFLAPRAARGGRLLLDLGQVGDLAEVSLNGRVLRTVWTPPYRLDVTDAVKRGRNNLTVKVTNVWANRLIGDAQTGAAKITTTYMPTYGADAPLRPAGLIGPVSLVAIGAR